MSNDTEEPAELLEDASELLLNLSVSVANTFLFFLNTFRADNVPLPFRINN